MQQKTSLFDLHLKSGAKMVDFAGWQMPIHYGSQVEEHNKVRQHAGMFDVSHMTIVDVEGERAEAFLRHVLANDVKKLNDGKALYGCMLNPQGGIIDDLITYKRSLKNYRIVVNAATTEKDIKWLQEHALPFQVTVQKREDLGLLAVQGPKAREIVSTLVSAPDTLMSVKPFSTCTIDDYFIARTGYTGEDGFEIALKRGDMPALYEKLLKKDVSPIGLGARDTLRLEAGLNLYGQDMDESITPFESNLAWTVDLKDEARDFIGKAELLKQREQGITKRLRGIVLQERGVLRPNMKVFMNKEDKEPCGVLTSGSFSPTLQSSIGFARILNGETDEVYVGIRDKKCAAKIVKPPFVKQGKANF